MKSAWMTARPAVTDWQTWFAWRPIMVAPAGTTGINIHYQFAGNYRWVWWEYVERRGGPQFGYYYRELPHG